jgi:hypothetical protein
MKLLVDRETVVRTLPAFYRQSVVRFLIGDPKLTLQGREISDLELSTRTFTISQIWPEIRRPGGFVKLLEKWTAKKEMDEPWWLHDEAPSPPPKPDAFSARLRELMAGGEGPTRAEMAWSLMNEPIRKPIELSLCPCAGVVFMHGAGNNRLSASLLRGLPAIPAVACVLLWPAGTADPGDEAAASLWRCLVSDAAADELHAKVSRWRSARMDVEVFRASRAGMSLGPEDDAAAADAYFAAGQAWGNRPLASHTAPATAA